MDKISTSELITKISASTGREKRFVKEVLTDLSAQINGHIANGTAVAVSGLGKFYPKDREARSGRHPISGEAIIIPAKRVLSFKASKASK